ALGVALLTIGLYLYEDRPHFSQVLLGGGVGVFYITTYAAFAILDPRLLDYPVAMSLMVATTALALSLAARQNAVVLSLIGTLGGLLTPFVLYTGDKNLPGLVGYTCVVLAGASAIYFYRGWHSLLWTAVGGGWAVLGLGWLGLQAGRAPFAFADQAAL